MPIVMPSVAPNVILDNGAGRSSGRSAADGSSAPSVPERVASIVRRFTGGFSNQVKQDTDFSREQSNTAFAQSLAAAREQRAWEERMSNTAYLRAAKQLQQLGINPYVMLSGFSSASTPSGASGSGYVGQSVSATSARASQYSSNAHTLASIYHTTMQAVTNMLNSAFKAASAAGA